MIDDLDYYREKHPRESGVPHNEYNLRSYQDWRAESLGGIEYVAVNMDDGDAKDCICALIKILQEDPRR